MWWEWMLGGMFIGSVLGMILGGILAINLRAEIEELSALNEKMADILNSIAAALRGPHPELKLWSWHDLPKRVKDLMAKNVGKR